MSRMPKKSRARVRKETVPAQVAPDAAMVAAHKRRAHLRREIGGIALLLAAVFIAGSLVAGGAAGGRSCASAGGVFGPVGACLRSGVLVAFGELAAVILPFIPAVHALRLLGRIEESEDRRWLFFTIGLAAIVPVAAALIRGAGIDAGRVDMYAGLAGSFVGFYLVRALGMGGAWVVVVLGLSALMAGTLAWNPIRMLIGGSTRRAADGDGLGAGSTNLPGLNRPADAPPTALAADAVSRAE
ncbi:MAG TPA: hypothetical protein VHE78_15305, partial [Gemmatimonadaceae bacterium]|nr:hypothetical protein [Gemmatimonadaceae bacterium]